MFAFSVFVLTAASDTDIRCAGSFCSNAFKSCASEGEISCGIFGVSSRIASNSSSGPSATNGSLPKMKIHKHTPQAQTSAAYAENDSNEHISGAQNDQEIGRANV